MTLFLSFFLSLHYTVDWECIAQLRETVLSLELGNGKFCFSAFKESLFIFDVDANKTSNFDYFEDCRTTPKTRFFKATIFLFDELIEVRKIIN